MNTFVEMRVTKAAISRVVSLIELCPGFDEDERLLLDMLEGETDLNEIVRRLLNENEDDEGLIEALKSQMKVRGERKARIESRIDARKNAVASLMESAGLVKLPLPEATLSLRNLKPRPKIVDEDALPPEFKVAVMVPDKDAINAAFEEGKIIPGVVRSNGGTSLTVRRK